MTGLNLEQKIELCALRYRGNHRRDVALFRDAEGTWCAMVGGHEYVRLGEYEGDIHVGLHGGGYASAHEAIDALLKALEE